MTQQYTTTQWAQRCSVGFIFLLAALHIIEPRLNPSWNFISEYETGRLGWLMQGAFLLMGLSCILLATALWKQVNIAGKIGVAMLLIAAIGLLMGGIFKTDALNTPVALQTQSGKLHQTGAMLDQIPFAAILITIALFRKKDWQFNKLLLLVWLLLVWFGFIFFVGSIKAQFPADGKFGPAVVVGWQNRIMIVTQAIWLICIAGVVQKNSLSVVTK